MKLLLAILASAILFALSGCADYGVTASVFLIDPNSGAKGGLTATQEGTTITGNYLDDEGNVVGGGSIFLPRAKVEVTPEK